eukprot:scaffold257799_cov15-Tisochrysis_lutea.AAC.1
MIKFTKLALGAAGVLMGVSLGELQQGGALVWTHNGKAPVWLLLSKNSPSSTATTARSFNPRAPLPPGTRSCCCTIVACGHLLKEPLIKVRNDNGVLLAQASTWQLSHVCSCTGLDTNTSVHSGGHPGYGGGHWDQCNSGTFSQTHGGWGAT